jgi:hypothetical protein
MNLDYHDPVAIDTFADEMDRTLDARMSPSPLWELLGLWAVSGGALTLAQGIDAGWLYPIRLAGIVIWAVRVRSYLGSQFDAGPGTHSTDGSRPREAAGTGP